MTGGRWAATGLLLLAVWVKVDYVRANDGDAVFIREFALIRQENLSEDLVHETSQKPEDPSSRTARSEEDGDTLWDAWGPWSECSRTCGGGASYSLRRCLTSKTCEGQNIKYRTCSNVDCPLDAGDFRAQQCSAHADVRHQGQYHEWLPVYNDPDNPCALKCKSKGSGLLVELAPKVLDGTRCYTESLDMCISGLCQVVGCDHELGSGAKEDNCGVCGGDGSSCRLVRGQYKSQHSSGKTVDTVVVIPFKSRHVRLILKGPDHLYVESKTLQGAKGQRILEKTGQYQLENTTLDYQKLPDKEVLRIPGPLGADFTVQVQFASGPDSVVQYLFYQPIVHRWRETDFFPCSVTCGGGYQLTSAECFDLRSGRVVVDQYCHYYPENVKPKPRLQECNMEPCLASDGYKQIMPYDLYHPLPRWESSPWTACSTSCGGGVQSRSVSCVEEDMQGTVTVTDEWKCLYAPKMAVLQPCSAFDCPTWVAQEWSPCTVTCGQGLRYRVVLCIDHRGLHAGGCNPATKPHIKEECLVTVPCYKTVDTLPVEAKPPWHKQAIELDQEIVVTEEPDFIPGPWQPCSRTCGVGTERRTVKCQVLLSFARTVADLPDDECKGVKPATDRVCYRTPCRNPEGDDDRDAEKGEDREEEGPHEWEYDGFTECSKSCGGGVQEAVVICLNKQTREAAADQSWCASTGRPLPLLQDCRTQPCPPRWEVGEWSQCSASCGVGLRSRTVACVLGPPSQDNSTSEILPNENCRDPKPNPVQACNRFDCPPVWETPEWGQCSGPCGDGVERRPVLCKQRLADGTILELPDTFCPSKMPPNQRACSGEQPCPPQWVTSWSQCSVTCGNGMQRLEALCGKQGEDGRSRTVHPSNCSSLARPTGIRLCSLRLCKNSPNPSPAILAQRNVYIQWRTTKKVHLVVGGAAYLLPRTSVVLRCPTRHIRKANIRWLKEGKPPGSLPGLSATPMGLVKIQHVGNSDGGRYTCVAGQAEEHLDLRVIGAERRLHRPQAERVRELSLFPTGYDHVVQRLLQLKAAKNKTASEDRRGALDIPDVVVLDSQKLDEIDTLRGQGEEVIALLLSKLTPSHYQTNESTHQNPEMDSASAQGPLLRTPKTKSYSTRSRSPVIIQSPPKTATVLSSDVTVSIGAPVVLRKPYASLEIKCESVGSPEPSLTWTKNGKRLRYDSRIDISPGGSLKIRSPNRADEGLYTCTARNRLGTSSRSSWLQIAAGSGRNCVQAVRASGPVVCPDPSDGSIQPAASSWRADPWAPCSASCGGGSQTRRVRCVESGSREVARQRCASAGRRPSDARICNVHPCASWATSTWGVCHGQCAGSSSAAQYRHVFCRDRNGTEVPSGMCGGLRRPSSARNCSADACAPQWRVGPWTQCTATCGRHGFQSRRVVCAQRNGGKAARERRCVRRPRPPSWQRCNTAPCGRARECRDSTRYCEKVRELDLCMLPQFKSRCCHSCLGT
ncbi:ADAMTS-like protein 1 isoform X2 [Syngnathoides biaculeatus]|uniref:ADAMTS-like protein 1 isoform X2 n=1 Tax=Syngnathoides biaculeatus TaxID=300417 RepID=UPI002ADD45A0|nr:ADAMTS-like protein 1 isoform X2 [Syngnathoides biaculeatus]